MTFNLQTFSDDVTMNTTQLRRCTVFRICVALTATMIAAIPNHAVGFPCPDAGYHSTCWKFREGPGCDGAADGDSGAGPTTEGNSAAGHSAGAGVGGCASCFSHGMPQYWVSESFLNLRVEDIPLGYSPAIGPKVWFQLSYRQRGVVPEEDSYFSVGTNWSCSFRAYVLDHAGGIRLHRHGAGFLCPNDQFMRLI